MSPPPPPARSRPLRPRERRLLLALAEAALPATGRLPGGGERAVERFGLFLQETAPTLRRLFLGLLWSLEAWARLRTGRSFARLPVDRRAALLLSLQRGPAAARRLIHLLTVPLKIAHFDDPAVHALMGSRYSPEPVVERAPPRFLQRVQHLPDADADLEITAEVVVIGTGAGGAVVGRELAARGHAVVMLEEGPYLRRPDFAFPAAEKLNRLYRDGGMLASLGDPPIVLQLGCCVGGTTTINSGTCYRTPPGILRRWRDELGLVDFTASGLGPYLQRVESNLGVCPAQEKNLGRIPALVRRGCETLGYACEPVPRNAPDCDAQAHCQFGCPTDAKRSTNVSYVPQALQSGAQLFTGARATRILLRDHRARGVLAEASGPGGRRRLTVRADAVVVSCGSLLTPLLLRRSGLGRRLPALGRHLSLHPAGVVLAEFDEPVRGWEGIPQGFAITQFADDGIVLEGGFPRLEFAATFVQAQGRAFMERMERFDRLAAFGYMIRDESRGRVLAGPAGMPLIRYTLLPSDLRRIHQAIHLLCRVFLAAGARQVHPGLAGVEPISDALGLARLAQLRASTGRLDLAAFHPLGTARLGVDPAVSVTGPDHQVHGVSGLYVVDGSSVPTSLGVNPQLTIMALATRAAEIIGSRLAH